MTLSFVPPTELATLRGLSDPYERAEAFADACRINTLSMIAAAGSGHPGTSLGCLDVVSWLHLSVLGDDDRYFSSKGHDVPALYAVLAGLDRLSFDMLTRLRRRDGLPGHPDVLATPAVWTSTGSLGMGLSKARGFALADRLAGRRGDIYVLVGDGELQEGQTWEAMQPTANDGLGAITVVVDANAFQSDTWVEHVSSLGDLAAKAGAFGWATDSCDGNRVRDVAEALRRLRRAPAEIPKLLVAHTRKGAGVSFMEPRALPRDELARYPFHSGAPSEEQYLRAIREVSERLSRRLGRPVELTGRPRTVERPPARQQRLVPAYGQALLREAEHADDLVVLDADLRVDCGVDDFARRYRERFYECGIAEQDMVSQAGAMALAGLRPVVHSFACFLTSRANEQIYNAACERTRVVYVGSLAGLVPGGPGHSHQAVRDIAAMAAIPGMILLEPYCEAEVRQAVEWIVARAEGPAYLRLVSAPVELGFEPTVMRELEPGRGTLLREGDGGSVVTTGPLLVAEAWKALDLLRDMGGPELGLIALPWLNRVDGEWLGDLAGGRPIVCLDNHVLCGGQGEAIARSVAEHSSSRVHRLGVADIPVCGTPPEVLAAHGIDASAIAGHVAAMLSPVR